MILQPHNSLIGKIIINNLQFAFVYLRWISFNRQSKGHSLHIFTISGIHVHLLPHSVPSPELRASPAPSPSSAVTKKSNSFRASSVSASSSDAKPSFPTWNSRRGKREKKQKTKHKLRIKEEVLKDGRVKEGGTGEKNNSGDLKGAACSLFTLVLCFLALWCLSVVMSSIRSPSSSSSSSLSSVFSRKLKVSRTSPGLLDINTNVVTLKLSAGLCLCLHCQCGGRCHTGETWLLFMWKQY